MQAGNEVWYQYLASLGDPDYSKFWNRIIRDPENTRVNNIKEGIDKIGKEPAVFHVSETMLKNNFLENPPTTKFKLFGRGRSIPMSIILTNNSPLKPILNKGFKKVCSIMFIMSQIKYQDGYVCNLRICNSFYFSSICKGHRKWRTI